MLGRLIATIFILHATAAAAQQDNLSKIVAYERCSTPAIVSDWLVKTDARWEKYFYGEILTIPDSDTTLEDWAGYQYSLSEISGHFNHFYHDIMNRKLPLLGATTNEHNDLVRVFNDMQDDALNNPYSNFRLGLVNGGKTVDYPWGILSVYSYFSFWHRICINEMYNGVLDFPEGGLGESED